MNFIESYKQGKEGNNVGLPTGIKPLTRALNGIRKKAIYGVAADAKVGKTKLVDFCFLIYPYYHMLKTPGIKINWIYYSFEIDRVQKEFNFAAFWFWKDYNITEFEYEGRKYEMCSDYLMGKLINEQTNEVIPVSSEHEALLKIIYTERIVPMFGEYSFDGRLIKKGCIDFIEERDNPTGMRNYLLNYADKHGEFIHEEYETTGTDNTGKSRKEIRKRITGWKPNDPDVNHIIITDHIRKLKRERGYTAKENIDKYIEYQVEFRNWCGFTFVDIVHINRQLTNIERIKYKPEYLYPTSDDVKDTGNLAEDADFMLTMMDANDDKYGITKHFGIEVAKYPNYRSIHLVQARQGKCPLHIQVNMFGAINLFDPIS